MDKFTALEREMATVRAELTPLKEAVTNFRSLDRNVNEFMTGFRTHQADEEKRVRDAAIAVGNTLVAANSRRDRIVAIFGVIISALLLLVAALTLHRDWKDSHLRPPSITAPKITGEVANAHTTQDAANAPL